MKKLPIQRLFAGFLFAVLVFAPVRYFQSEKEIERTNAYLNEGIVLSSSIYVTARVSNGLISVLQESTATVSPLGIGVELGAGQILDPLNDAIERLSDLVSISMAISMTQRVLMEIVHSHFIYPFYVFVVLGFLGFVYKPNHFLYKRIYNITVFLFLLFCFVPIYSNVAAFIDKHYFNEVIEKDLDQFRHLMTIAKVQEDATMASFSSHVRESEGQSNVLNKLNGLIQKATGRASEQVDALKKTFTYVKENFDTLLNGFVSLFRILLTKILFQVFIIPLSSYYFAKYFYHLLTGDIFEGLKGVGAQVSDPKVKPECS